MIQKLPSTNNDQPAQPSWEDLARQGQLENAIEMYVRKFDHVTFVELQRRLESFAKVRGDFDLQLVPNAVIWSGMSAEFVAAIQALLKAKRIFLHPSRPLLYLLDGGGLQLPTAKSIPKGGFKTRRWLPATLRVVALGRNTKKKRKIMGGR